MFMLPVAVLIVLILHHFIPSSQKRYHWLKSVGIRVSVANFDVDYGIGISVT